MAQVIRKVRRSWFITCNRVPGYQQYVKNHLQRSFLAITHVVIYTYDCFEFVIFEFKRQFDRRSRHVPILRLHHGKMGLVVRVLQHRRGRHTVVPSLVVVRVRYASTASVHIARGADPHHQQSHQRGVPCEGKFPNSRDPFTPRITESS